MPRFPDRPDPMRRLTPFGKIRADRWPATRDVPHSRAFLDALIALLPRSRLLLLMNYRPAFEHDWRGHDGFNEIVLEPLAPADARALLAALLGEDHSFAHTSNGMEFL